MNILKAHNLACPVDGVRLEFHEKQLVCGHGHAFDIARQGYVNLLPVQHKRSKQPGDSKEMVAARVQFLNSGLYEPIAKALAEIAFAGLAGDKAGCLVDAGCGEGYYLDYLLHYLKDKKRAGDLCLVGMDISKAAIVEAAKRSRQITWIVGTNRRPPLDDASVDVILCVFGFHSFDGFHKILKPGGKLVLVEPGPDHLKELREIIYAEVRKSDPQDLSCAEQAGFAMLDSRPLQFTTGAIRHELINKLLLMTPHFFRASKQGRAAAGKLQELDLTVDVVFRTLEKCSA
jgi:23S rRNA (guanine745-N1)-methyltransferase